MITPQLLQRYVDEQCTLEEHRDVVRWLQDDAANHSLLQTMMEKQWETGGPVGEGGELKEILLRDLRQQLYPVQQEEAEVVPIFRRRWFYGIAAASVAAIFLLALYFRNPGGDAPDSDTLSAIVQWDTIVNSTVDKQHKVLPDSTQVWLAPGSRLSYAISKARPERAARLEGQAFFDVAHDPARPFVVYSGAVETRVLGTAFNVEAYEEEKEITISLVRGRVAIRRALLPVSELEGGEMLTYTKADSTSQKRELKINRIEEWTSNRIVFNDVLVKDALQRLARQYQLSIRFEEGVRLDNKRFSTVFDRESPAQMIQNILFITDYSYKVKGKTVTIYP